MSQPQARNIPDLLSEARGLLSQGREEVMKLMSCGSSHLNFLMLICQHGVVQLFLLYPQEKSECGCQDIPAILTLFYRANLIQGITLTSAERLRMQKGSTGVATARMKGYGDKGLRLLRKDTPAAGHSDAQGSGTGPQLRDLSNSPKLCVSVYPSVKWDSNYLHEVVERTY